MTADNIIATGAATTTTNDDEDINCHYFYFTQSHINQEVATNINSSSSARIQARMYYY